MISLENVIPGMVLAANVLDQQAQILLPENTTLTREHIAFLTEKKINAVQIKATVTFLLEEKPNLAALSQMNLNLFQFLDSNPVPTFVLNAEHTITHWNKAAEHVLGYAATTMIASQKQWQPFYKYKRPVLADLILASDAVAGLEAFYHGRYKPSTLIKNAYEVDDFFPNLGESGLWLHFTAAPLYDNAGKMIGAIETLEDITERRDAELALRKAHDELENLVDRRTEQLAISNQRLAADIKKRAVVEDELVRRNAELTQLNEQLSKAQQQLLQSEKLASIGQLAAGVAHEINNPVGYVFSNFGTLENYLKELFDILNVYEKNEAHIADEAARAEITAAKETIELGFLKQDIPSLVRQSKEGICRVRKIVQDLKDFSRIDATQVWQKANLHDCIESTLNIVNNEIKYKADIVKDMREVPEIECLPSQVSQIMMNLLVNASQALGEERGKITIRVYPEEKRQTDYLADEQGQENPQGELGAETKVEKVDMVAIEIEDTGSGMSQETASRIFDPFFTTKPVGQGTGLGLSIVYGIIQKHHGTIEVQSTLGVGTCFKVRLPVTQPVEMESSEVDV